jgi:hypothetical protein
MENGRLTLASFLFSAYSITAQDSVNVGIDQVKMLPTLTIIMDVSILDHVSCESQSIGYSFASTECGKVACNRIDAAYGITLVALVANRVGSCCCAGSQEINLTLPRSGICEVGVTVDSRLKSAKVAIPLVDVWFDGDGMFDEG